MLVILESQFSVQQKFYRLQVRRCICAGNQCRKRLKQNQWINCRLNKYCFVFLKIYQKIELLNANKVLRVHTGTRMSNVLSCLRSIIISDFSLRFVIYINMEHTILILNLKFKSTYIARFQCERRLAIYVTKT